MAEEQIKQEDQAGQEEQEDTGFEDAFAEFTDGDTAASDDSQGDDHVADDDQQVEADDDKVERSSSEVEQDNKPEGSEKAQRKIDELEYQLKSQTGRVSGLTKTLAQTRQELDAIKKAKEDSAASGEGSEGEWERLQEEFPELAAAVDKRLSGVNTQIQQTVDAVGKVADSVNPFITREELNDRKSRYEQIEQKHKDWENIVFGDGKTDFQKWKDEQPAPVQEMIKSQDPRDAVYLLDGFKNSSYYNGKGGPSEVERIKQEREQKLQRSAGVKSKRVGRSSGNPGEGDFDSAFDYFAKQKEKKLAGRPH